MKMEEGELRYKGREIDPADYDPEIHLNLDELKGRCCSCGDEVDGMEAIPAPDPYDEEIGGCDDNVVECDSCRSESARDI